MRRTFLVALCLVALSHVLDAAELTVQWTATSYKDDLTVPPGTTLNFVYTMYHNLFQFEDAEAYSQCEWRGTLVGGSSDGTPGKGVTLSEPGVYYFGCALGVHCSDMGQKLSVVVDPEAPEVSEVDFLQQSYKQPKPSSMDAYFLPGEEQLYRDFWYNDTAIPAKVTTYMQTGHLLDISREYNIVGFEFLSGGGRFLHHFVLSECYHRDINTELGQGNDMGDCENTIWGWAPGIDSVILPKEAAFRVGPAEGQAQALHMDIHYDNPMAEVGQTDTSGFRMFYTPSVHLRPHRLGVMWLGGVTWMGANTDNALEKGHRQVVSTSACEMRNQEPLTIVGYNTHAHLLGRVVRTEQYKVRQGADWGIGVDATDFAKVRNIANDEHFLFDNQYYASVDPLEGQTIERGDIIQTTCVYDTSARSEDAYGGAATQDEMCVTFVSYYPKERRSGRAGGLCQYVSRPMAGIMGDEEQLPASFMSYAFEHSLVSATEAPSGIGGQAASNSDNWQSTLQYLSSRACPSGLDLQDHAKEAVIAYVRQQARGNTMADGNPILELMKPSSAYFFLMGDECLLDYAASLTREQAAAHAELCTAGREAYNTFFKSFFLCIKSNCEADHDFDLCQMMEDNAAGLLAAPPTAEPEPASTPSPTVSVKLVVQENDQGQVVTDGQVAAETEQASPDEPEESGANTKVATSSCLASLALLFATAFVVW